MDWIKVKIRHIDYDFDSVDPAICWAWMKAMSMTAALERIPSDIQIQNRIGIETLKKLKNILTKNGTSLEEVLVKVMEDVEHINKRRKDLRRYVRKHRSKHFVSAYKTVTKPIREDKIREDKIRVVVGADAPPTDKEFIETLKANSSYKHINIYIELGKMDAWLSVHKGRQKTRRFIINWLNKIDAPVKIEKPHRKIELLKKEEFIPPTDEDRAKLRSVIK